jgi:hypothetical protein
MQAEGQPGVSYSQSANALVVNVFGANPLLPSPDIDLQLTMRRTGGLIMLDLIGDAFPNAEVFYVDQVGESRMLHTFSTAGGVSGPYFYLPGEGRLPMGRAIIEAP